MRVLSTGYCVAICLIAIIHSFLSKFVWAPINRTNQTSIDHDDEKMIVLFDIKLTCSILQTPMGMQTEFHHHWTFEWKGAKNIKL